MYFHFRTNYFKYLKIKILVLKFSKRASFEAFFMPGTLKTKGKIYVMKSRKHTFKDQPLEIEIKPK